MGIVLAILFIISVVFTALYYTDSDDWSGKVSFTVITILSIIALVMYFNSPTAIDVYRDKTELKITGTYKDSIFIPKDSIVIFKNR